MAKQQSQGKRGSRKIGRSKNKCARYAGLHKREMHKVKHVLQSNGLQAAQTYAKEHNVVGYLGTLTRR